MNIKEIFDLAIKMGVESDFRGEETIKAYLNRRKEKYNILSEEKKKNFDTDCFVNPYMDSSIYHSDNRDVKKILTGIDISGEELLIARELGVDLVIAHHPVGKGLAWLADVMNLQIDVYNYYGVPFNQAEKLTHERLSEVAHSVSPSNHNKVVDIAKLLNVNFINIHTPADNLAASFLKSIIEKENPKYLDELISLLENIPEHGEAIKIGVGPKILVGSPESRCGKIALSEITGGTEGSGKIFEKLAQAGIGTVIGMHMSEKNKKEAEAANINVVIAGHISSDSLGMNLFLDELEKNKIEIISCGGLTRFKRF